MRKKCAVVALCYLTLLPAMSSANCDPIPQWVWMGSEIGHADLLLFTEPTTADLDGDGTIEVLFAPRVALESERVIIALDGKTGTTRFVIDDPLLLGASDVALADLDSNGSVEVVYLHKDCRRVVALDANGSLVFVSDPAPSPVGWVRADYASPSIADLNQDGSPEIVSGATVWSTTGVFLWQGTAGRGAWNGVGGENVSGIADVNISPGLEISAGDTLYSADGSVLWQNPDLTDGYTAVGDLDDNGMVEVVLVSSGNELAIPPTSLVTALSGDTGTPVAPSVEIGYRASPPAIGNLDGVAGLEFTLTDHVNLYTFGLEGGLIKELWAVPISDPSRVSSPTIFDFEGGGVASVAYLDEDGWYVFDGRDGSVLDSMPHLSGTWLEGPVVVNLDADGCAEVLISAGYNDPNVSNTLTTYECQSATTTPRSVWNQQSYHVVNIGDDGSIPVIEPSLGGTTTGWRAQVSVPTTCPCGTPPPGDVGNTILGVKVGAGLLDVRFIWTSDPDSTGYAVYRDVAKGTWPASPTFQVVPPEITLPSEVTPPPPLYFYKVAGENCLWEEGPQ